MQKLANPAKSDSHYGVSIGATTYEAKVLTSASFKRMLLLSTDHFL